MSGGAPTAGGEEELQARPGDRRERKQIGILRAVALAILERQSRCRKAFGRRPARKREHVLVPAAEPGRRHAAAHLSVEDRQVADIARASRMPPPARSPAPPAA